MTQEQIGRCQEAGNIAHQQAESFGQTLAGQYDAYRAAYNAEAERIAANTLRGLQNVMDAPEPVDVEPHEYHGCTLADVLADNGEREEYATHTEGHW